MSTAAIARTRFVFVRSVLALMIREMTTTYGRSPGGYIWAFAEPIGGIAMMTIVFTMIARNPALGTNFPFFFASGVLPFMMYQSTSSKISTAIRYSRQLLAYPHVTYIDAIVARFLLTVLTEFLVAVCTLAMIIIVYGLQPHIDYLLCGQALMMAALLGLGVGLVNCYMTDMYPIWQAIWSVLNRPLFIISGIFFLVDAMPAQVRDILMYNPVVHVVMEMRRGLFDTYDAPHASMSYVFLIAISLGTLGMLLLHLYHKVILDEGA